LGFVAVFAAASHTPLACAVLGWELFGPEILLPALLACLVANAVATGTGLYDARTQSDKASQ
jgi:H+/Cl- antiporter ClcA